MKYTAKKVTLFIGLIRFHSEAIAYLFLQNSCTSLGGKSYIIVLLSLVDLFFFSVFIFLYIRLEKWPSAKLVLANFDVMFSLLVSKVSKPKLLIDLKYDVGFSSNTSLQKPIISQKMKIIVWGCLIAQMKRFDVLITTQKNPSSLQGPISLKIKKRKKNNIFFKTSQSAGVYWVVISVSKRFIWAIKHPHRMIFIFFLAYNGL